MSRKTRYEHRCHNHVIDPLGDIAYSDRATCVVCTKLATKQKQCLKCDREFTPTCGGRFVCFYCTELNKIRMDPFIEHYV